MNTLHKTRGAAWHPGRFASVKSDILHKLTTVSRGRKQAISMFVDASLVMVSLWCAYSLRHGQPFSDFFHTWHIFLLLTVITVASLHVLGVYRWVVRSSNHRLFKKLAVGCGVSSLTLLALFFLVPPDRVNPRSLFVIYALVLMFSTICARIGWCAAFDVGSKGTPIAVYGAGSAGVQLVQLLSANNQHRPVVFIDDDRSLEKTTQLGLPIVYGRDPRLKAILDRFEVGRVVMAMPSLSAADYHRKLEEIDELGLPVLTMPSVVELMTGQAQADDIRDVSISDILGRSEVPPDMELMARRVTGKTILVTGGGGSIGSEICRQIMALSPHRLVIVDNCEANLYHITEELGRERAKLTIADPAEFTPLLCSVLDENRMQRIFAKYRFDTVYHAAAYKHVPIVEAQPDQGVEVNVFGTLCVLDCAIDHNVSDFVLISTDKAVRPKNSMGASKRVAELVLQAKAASSNNTRISMVRFGNVLGSSGSVVPKFKQQILGGGPITLTHKDVTRFFMTIPEASQLVLQASAIARGGDVFVLDMGEPVRIEDLATTMVRLYGRKLQRDTGNGQDIDIVVEGLRPGEKLYEELFISDDSRDTEVAKIFTTNEVWVEWQELLPKLDEMRRCVSAQDSGALRKELMSLAFLKDDSEASYKISVRGTSANETVVPALACE